MSGADGMVLAEWAFFANPVGCRSAGSGAAQAGREAAAEPGASPFGVGMLQVIEDGQGVLPGVAGGVGLADRLAGVTEVQEDRGRVVPGPQPFTDPQGGPEASDGLGGPAQAVVRVAHGVPGPGLVDRVAVLAAEAERLRAAAQGFLVVAHLCGEPADRVESPGRAGVIALGLEQGEGL